MRIKSRKASSSKKQHDVKRKEEKVQETGVKIKMVLMVHETNVRSDKSQLHA